ncbi:MAG: hypothetical protein NTW21_18350 [Verrucomicrobia bacterium]|nr:hypothetical protein [Verrucomicrobiota bacterium]
MPFDEDPPEVQIKIVLANSTTFHPQPNGHLRPFMGGVMMVHKGRIDLLGVEVGGNKSCSIIRRVMMALAPKPGAVAKKITELSSESASAVCPPGWALRCCEIMCFPDSPKRQPNDQSVCIHGESHPNQFQWLPNCHG